MTFGAWPPGKSGGGGARAKVPKLQAVLPGCGAAWSLLGTPGNNASFYADRGPNAGLADLSLWHPNPIQDLIPGAFSVCNDLAARQSRVDCAPAGPDPYVFSVLTDKTFIGRVMWRPSADPFQVFWNFSSNFSTGSLAPACTQQLATDPDGVLREYHQYGPMTGFTDVSTISGLTFPQAKWVGVACRWLMTDATHCTIRFDISGVGSFTSAPVVAATGQDSQSRNLGIGQYNAWESPAGNINNGSLPWVGGMADFQTLPTRYATDLEVTTAFADMLGL